MLNIIYGVSGTGKSEYCISCAAKRLDAGKKSMIIVPEQFSHIKEAQLTERAGFISEDIKAVSFKRLSYSYPVTAGRHKKFADKTQKSMMLSKINC